MQFNNLKTKLYRATKPELQKLNLAHVRLKKKSYLSLLTNSTKMETVKDDKLILSTCERQGIFSLTVLLLNNNFGHVKLTCSNIEPGAQCTCKY